MTYESTNKAVEISKAKPSLAVQLYASFYDYNDISDAIRDFQNDGNKLNWERAADVAKAHLE